MLIQLSNAFIIMLMLAVIAGSHIYTQSQNQSQSQGRIEPQSDKRNNYQRNIAFMPNRRRLIDVDLETYLHAIRDEILTSDLYEVRMRGTHSTAFMEGYYRNYTRNEPIIVIQTMVHTEQFGNQIGYYLAQVSCALLSGLHVIVIDEVSMATVGRHRDHDHLAKHHSGTISAFLRSLPTVLVCPTPAGDISAAMGSYSATCDEVSNNIFPWESNFDVRRMIPLWRHLLSRPIAKQVVADNYTTTLILDHKPKHDPELHVDLPALKSILPSSELTRLPTYPDVTIQFRCSDNIMFPTMGLLPFRHIIEHIPARAKFIFITAEPFSDHGGIWPGGITDEGNAICNAVALALQADIQSHFPRSHVVVRRGGPLFLIIAMFAFSRMAVICSASTFCLHFATANVLAKAVYFPQTPLFYGQTASNLTCCGDQPNIFTIPSGCPVSRWCDPQGVHIKDVKALSPTYAVQVLRNHSYTGCDS